MARAEARLGFIRFCLTVAILAVLARAAQLQLVRGAAYRQQAARARTVTEILPARRGSIYDRGMLPLAETQEAYHVTLAPEQVVDTTALATAVARALDENAGRVASRLRSGARSVYFYGPYTALDVQAIRDLPGVHLESFFRRIHPMGALANRTLGVLEPDTAVGASGIESSLDSVLEGEAGQTVQLRDPLGRRYDSPARLVRSPVAGNSVVLTIDARLQEIAERKLDAALEASDATSGDVVFMDPSTGELLAVASRVEGERSSASAFTSPYEPGSTAKLFTAAALLLHHAVDSADAVSGENGKWTVPTRYGRPYVIHDDHADAGRITLARAIEVSSNIAMAKFSRRLEPAQLYEALRAFGFGTRTGVEFPAESPGYLPSPSSRAWRLDYTMESLSRGYGMSVTPVQLAAAYSAIANGGVLYAPALVKEIHSPDGVVLYEHRPEPVRRVLPPEVAAILRRYLKGAVGTGGTGERGQIQNYALVGKTGTAKIASNGQYLAGKYSASFAAIWPADRPQIVAVVKIEDPKGAAFYGGLTAAPLTKQMLEEALASRNRALDLQALADTGARRAAPTLPEPVVTEDEAPVVQVAWPNAAPATTAATREIPDVTGLTTRAAVRTVLEAGFQVKVAGDMGTAERTLPASGTTAGAGSVVTIVSRATLGGKGTHAR